MGVKSDKWIRRMAQTQGMITPFEPGQVKAIQRTELYRNSAGLVGSLAELNKQDPDAVIEASMTLREPCLAGATGAEKIVSYGTSSYGYDVRCGTEFKIFTNINSTIIDPKNFDEKNFVSVSGESCIIPPNSFALGVSLERFKIPRDVLTICLGKSTYARCGIIVNVTPLEPEWEGHITMEFSNTTPLPARIYANEGCAQLLFLGADLELFSGATNFERKNQLTWRQHDPILQANYERQIRRDECETSYADRGGKYQNQVGVTLPSV